mmetsp:Transcript_16277/g.33497  ORF Transcript_16277/g.33497 Transcript_16277/m.33497 type:complete len:286 (+) Transcript_16277:1465-2322(+)
MPILGRHVPTGVLPVQLFPKSVCQNLVPNPHVEVLEGPVLLKLAAFNYLVDVDAVLHARKLLHSHAYLLEGFECLGRHAHLGVHALLGNINSPKGPKVFPHPSEVLREGLGITNSSRREGVEGYHAPPLALLHFLRQSLHPLGPPLHPDVLRVRHNMKVYRWPPLHRHPLVPRCHPLLLLPPLLRNPEHSLDIIVPFHPFHGHLHLLPIFILNQVLPLLEGTEEVVEGLPEFRQVHRGAGAPLYKHSSSLLSPVQVQALPQLRTHANLNCVKVVSVCEQMFVIII